MTAGEMIPDDDHVARHVKGSLVDGNRIDGNAFLRRPGSESKPAEEAPSCHWMEMFGKDPQQQECQVRAHSALKPATKAVFAVLNVGVTSAFVAHDPKHGCTIEFTHRPILPSSADSIGDPSHSEICGLPHPDDTPEAEAVGDLISRKVIRVFSTKSDGA